MQSYVVSGAGLEPATFGLWDQQATNCSTPIYNSLKIPPGFPSGRYYYNSILNVINITKIQIKYDKFFIKELKCEMDTFTGSWKRVGEDGLAPSTLWLQISAALLLKLLALVIKTAYLHWLAE